MSTDVNGMTEGNTAPLRHNARSYLDMVKKNIVPISAELPVIFPEFHPSEIRFPAQVDVLVPGSFLVR